MLNHGGYREYQNTSRTFGQANFETHSLSQPNLVSTTWHAALIAHKGRREFVGQS